MFYGDLKKKLSGVDALSQEVKEFINHLEVSFQEVYLEPHAHDYLLWSLSDFRRLCERKSVTN